MTFPSSSTAFARSTCEYPDITRNWFYDSGWKMRYRSGYDRNGFGVHPNVTSFTMHEEAHIQAGKVIRDLHSLGKYHGYAGVSRAYQWTGLAGAKVCKPGYHRYGAAIDFTRFDWGADCFVDTAVHGGARRYLRRRYLTVIATCRKHFGIVLHRHNDPDGSHWNHIHVDRGRKAVAMNWGYTTDTTIIQWAARDLAGVTDLAIDGDFGPKTTAAFKTLRSRFGAEDCDPTASNTNTMIWLNLIGRHGMTDQDAGTYTVNDIERHEIAAASD